MRRFLAALALTVGGLYLVLSFKSSPVTTVAVVPTPTPSDSRPRSSGVPVATAPPPTRTIDGSVVSMRWGDVQVAVTLRGSTITDVSTLKMPFDHSRSVYISQTVAPWLKQEVLQAQSAQIDSISGATYTSDAYVQSLQAALDQAHA